MFGSELAGTMVGSFFKASVYKWVAIIGGISAIGYIGVLKIENIRLKSKISSMQIEYLEMQDRVDILSEENEGLKIISRITIDQCEGILKYEREKPSRPGADTPITEEYLNNIFKGRDKRQ